jgi:FMN phosphatase YigB (HAD superfamily)
MDTLAARGPRGPAEEITAKVLGVEPASLLKALQKHEVDAQTTAWIGPITWMQKVLREAGIRADRKQAEKALFVLGTYTARQMQPYDGVFELLWWLKTWAITALYSTASPQGTTATRQLGFDQPLMRPFFSSETGYTKETDEAFEILIKKLGMEPGRMLFCDDHEDYTQRASRLGFQAVTVLSPTGHATRQLRGQPNLIDRLLAQDIIVMDHIAEVRELPYFQPSRA